MLCMCGADKNKTLHANDCPVTLGERIRELEAVIEAQKAVIANYSGGS